MAHFARVHKKTKEVLHVHVVDNDKLLDANGQEKERVGIKYLMEVHSSQDWINDVEFVQCSFNEKIRKNFPGIGYFYDAEKVAFISPKPFESWNLNELTAKYDPPTEYPKDGKKYFWDEKTNSWIEYTVGKK